MIYFLDTSYLVALTHSRDQFHQEAVSISKTLIQPIRLVTISAVLMEFANMLSSTHLRGNVFSYIQLLKNDKHTEIVFLSLKSCLHQGWPCLENIMTRNGDWWIVYRLSL
jgi:uncharacterized protein